MNILNELCIANSFVIIISSGPHHISLRSTTTRRHPHSIDPMAAPVVAVDLSKCSCRAHNVCKIASSSGEFMDGRVMDLGVLVKKMKLISRANN